MAGIRVVSDSACDLPDAVVQELGIEIVPLTVRFGETELVDRQDVTPSDFWSRCANFPGLPETAAPSPGAFEAAYRRLAEEGADGVVCVTLSSDLSGTFQAAELAAKAVAGDLPVRVVDSRFVTLAQGQLAMEAAKLAADGKGIEDVAGAAEDAIRRTRLYAALDTLDNLKKGGRIGGAQALIGTMLSIKPVIQVVDGKVEEEAKPRTRTRALKFLVDKVKEHGAVERLAIIHAQAPDLDEFIDMFADVAPRDDILVGDVGPVIGTHSGPRAVGVTFHVPR
jgi:DegV family protein with EDD domain